MASKYPQKQTGLSTHFNGSAFVMLIIGIVLTSCVRQFFTAQKPLSPSVAVPSSDPSIVKYTRGMSEAAVVRVDELCASLPKPEKFEFVSKIAPTETENFVSIGYTFRSSRATSEIYPSFILWFTQNGWTNNQPIYERLEFSKDNQTVWLAPYHIKEKGDFYTVSCTEWKTPPAKP